MMVAHFRHLIVGEDIVPTVLLLCLLLLPGLVHADEPTITVTLGNDTRTFTRGELLVLPETTTINVFRICCRLAQQRTVARQSRPMATRLPPIMRVLGG